jgi:quercetin dioxygenase-like cupin family protein
MTLPRSRLSDLIDYQPGAVVSRALLKRHAGTVTLFAFDTGEGLSEHTAPYDALLHLVEGRADVTLDGKVLRMEAGELLELPARVAHAVKATERFKMLLIMIRE